MPLNDISGMKFGKLTAIANVGKNAKRESIWLCKCDCGNETRVKLSNLRCDHTKSCGCLRTRDGK